MFSVIFLGRSAFVVVGYSLFTISVLIELTNLHACSTRVYVTLVGIGCNLTSGFLEHTNC